MTRKQTTKECTDNIVVVTGGLAGTCSQIALMRFFAELKDEAPEQKTCKAGQGAPYGRMERQSIYFAWPFSL